MIDPHALRRILLYTLALSYSFLIATALISTGVSEGAIYAKVTIDNPSQTIGFTRYFSESSAYTRGWMQIYSSSTFGSVSPTHVNLYNVSSAKVEYTFDPLGILRYQDVEITLRYSFYAPNPSFHRTYTIRFCPEYWLNVTTPIGVAVGSGHYAAGSVVSPEVKERWIEEGDTAYQLEGWRVRAADSGEYYITGGQQIQLQQVTDARAIWQRYFRVRVEGFFEKWIREDDNFTINLPSERGVTDVEKEVFVGWLGRVDMSSPEITLTASAPICLYPIYVKVYLVELSSPFGSLKGSGWYKSGDYADLEVEPKIVRLNSTTEAFFSHWEVNGSPINCSRIKVMTPMKVSAIWSTRPVQSADQGQVSRPVQESRSNATTVRANAGLGKIRVTVETGSLRVCIGVLTSFTLRFTDLTGQPVESANVSLMSGSCVVHPQSGYTDRLGAVVISVNATLKGIHRLNITVSKEGYETISTNADIVAEDNANAENVQVFASSSLGKTWGSGTYALGSIVRVNVTPTTFELTPYVRICFVGWRDAASQETISEESLLTFVATRDLYLDAFWIREYYIEGTWRNYDEEVKIHPPDTELLANGIRRTFSGFWMRGIKKISLKEGSVRAEDFVLLEPIMQLQYELTISVDGIRDVAVPIVVSFENNSVPFNVSDRISLWVDAGRIVTVNALQAIGDCRLVSVGGIGSKNITLAMNCPANVSVIYDSSGPATTSVVAPIGFEVISAFAVPMVFILIRMIHVRNRRLGLDDVKEVLRGEKPIPKGAYIEERVLRTLKRDESCLYFKALTLISSGRLRLHSIERGAIFTNMLRKMKRYRTNQ